MDTKDYIDIRQQIHDQYLKLKQENHDNYIELSNKIIESHHSLYKQISSVIILAVIVIFFAMALTFIFFVNSK